MLNSDRRQFLLRSAAGTAALAGLLARDGLAPEHKPHFTAKAKRVIFLFQSGGPSHLELLDYKPMLAKYHGKELPDSIRQGQRLTGMTSGQTSFPVIAPKFKFAQRGASGAWLRAEPLSGGAIATPSGGLWLPYLRLWRAA